MSDIIEIAISPDHINDPNFINQQLIKKLGDEKLVIQYTLKRRSIDARGKVLFRLQYQRKDAVKNVEISPVMSLSENSQKIIIVGAGPAGYFAALKCLDLGMIPIVLERGKDVKERRRDLRAIQQFHTVDPHSNYCFGEGGAGTYSDGKLYTRSHKRGNIQNILNTLFDHGASSDILVDAHPHIGSNKLPKIIEAIRHTIEERGGSILFKSYVVDLLLNNSKVQGVRLEDGQEIAGNAVILATGHSARDIFNLLETKKIKMEAKPFALGVRIEHPQDLIDQIQYRQRPRHINLPAAPYRVACQVDGKGVFSFCNCPGGLIVPAATAPGEIVVNGMSLSKRDSPYANSGFVTEISIEELNTKSYTGVMAALDFQKSVEQKIFNYGDGSQKAPGQLVTDFIKAKTSSKLNNTSYIPGAYAAPLHQLLPNYVYDRLRRGILTIDKKMKGFYSKEAQVFAVESRTSSPIKIPRDDETKMHPEIDGLFPCGEGAGYAGGILSAAMDGQNVAKAVKEFST